MNSESTGKGKRITQRGNSIEQRKAEKYLLKKLSRKLKSNLTKRTIKLDGRNHIEVDGYCESPSVLCEVWSHIGPPKSGQMNKVMKDGLKLLFAKEKIRGNAKCILLFGDMEAAGPFIDNNSWKALCLKHFGIEVRVIEFTKKIKAKVSKAQKRQRR